MAEQGTQIRIGGVRIALKSAGSLYDAADLLEGVTRANLRALRDDPTLRAEAIRRVLSPPCPIRCYVQQDGSNDCHCESGFQYASDEEAQRLEQCPARDTWSDIRSLLAGHHDAGRGPKDPIVCDCDDMGPAAVATAAWLSWFAPKGYSLAGVPALSGVLELAWLAWLAPQGYSLGGVPELGALERVDLGSWRDEDARFAIAITHPEGAPIAHLYALTNKRPPAPQPEILMPSHKIGDGPWYVWDCASHWGMKRPHASYYPNGSVVAYELRRGELDGLRPNESS